jgi:hypothetical protein
LAFSYRTIKPWFLTEGKLADVLITPSLGVPTGRLFTSSTPRHQQVFWRCCRGKRIILQGEFRTHILYFVLVLLYFTFACIFLSKNIKISFLIVVILLLLVHYVIP